MNKVIFRPTEKGYDFIHFPENFTERKLHYIDILDPESDSRNVRITFFGIVKTLEKVSDNEYQGSIDNVKLGKFLIIHEIRNPDGSVSVKPETKEVTGKASFALQIFSEGKPEKVMKKIGYDRKQLSFPLSKYRGELLNAWKNYDIPENIQNEILQKDSLEIKDELNKMLSQGHVNNRQWETIYNALQQAYYICEKHRCYEYYLIPKFIETEGLTIKGFNMKLIINDTPVHIQAGEKLTCKKEGEPEIYRYLFYATKEVIKWEI